MWQEPESYPSEPLFVQTPEGVDEDDGNSGNTHTHTRTFNLESAASVTVPALPSRSAADHRGGSGLPEAGVPPHPQRQGPVRGGQGGGGVLHPRHLSRDVQAVTAPSEPPPRVHGKISQMTKIKVSSNSRAL